MIPSGDELSQIPNSVRERFITPHGIKTLQRVSGGFSGALVFRCEGSGKYALRRWAKTKATRVREVHRLVSSAAERCTLFPRWVRAVDGNDIVCDDRGWMWDLAEWHDGEPLETTTSLDGIVRGASTIADAHQALRPSGEGTGVSGAIDARWNRLHELANLIPPALTRIDAAPPAIAATLRDAAALLLRWKSIATQLAGRLEAFRGAELPLQHVLRDVHREHILFLDGNPTGIVDFDAIRIDSPLLDISRWVTDFDAFGEEPSGVIEAALAGYGLERLFRTGTEGVKARKLVETLAVTTTWIGLANWVVWVASESRQFPDWQRVRIRIARLVDLAPRLRDCI
ncbi:MAG: aminoglycoside phosphotransferase family protein [Planctomycetota bacterium]